MDDVVRVRAAAREAVEDIEPDRLRRVLFNRLSDAPMTPAALTLVSARAPETSVDTDTNGIAERAAGVQLIYEGLRLTRSLAWAEPWAETADADVGDTDADLDVLAADVLVSRGFFLLARPTLRAGRSTSSGRSAAIRRSPEARVPTSTPWTGALRPTSSRSLSSLE